MTLEMTIPQVRQMLLHQQGLLTPPKSPARKQDVLAAIRRMGLLQIDTISVVARSPFLVLFARLGQYDPKWVDELQIDGRIFEYWSHAMCWLPVELYPHYASLIAHRIEFGFAKWSKKQAWLERHQKEVDHVLARIRTDGGLRSADFEHEPRRAGGWWNWKVEKMALEHLFSMGHLMVSHRRNFHRVYNLTERVTTRWPAFERMNLDAIYLDLVRRSLRALGVATEPWARDYYRLKRNVTQSALQALVQSGEAQMVQIEGLSSPAYVLTELLPLLRKAKQGKLTATHSAILSPFDPICWDRDRGRELFNFDYTIECYTPKAKRKYGYFTLPILHRGELIGRIDAKAHRKAREFEIVSLYLEKGVQPDERLVSEVARAIEDLANWHGTPKVRFTRSNPSAVAKAFRAQFKSNSAGASL